MASRGSNFLLDNIEKIILPIAGVICLWWLVTRVIMTPVVVELEGRRFSPGDIDNYIEKQTDTIVYHLRAEPGPGKVHQEELGAYVSELNDPLEIDTTLWPAVPRQTSEDSWDGRQYAVPEAPVISDAMVGQIRAMAYLPKQEVGSENTYDTVETELNDLDLVTVEAKLDVAGLYAAFYNSFASSAVKLEWRDPCLARPVFAAVQLQRAEKLADGGWSDWQDVPRPKIDHMRTMLEVIELVQDLPRGGMKVRLLQYDNLPVMSNILQPRPYDIASAEEYWFPPSLHKKFVSLWREQQVAERREEMERLREERDRELLEARRARREVQTTTTREPAADSGSSSVFSARGSGGSSSRGRVERPERPQRSREDRERERDQLRRQREQDKETTDDVYEQLEQLLVKNANQLDKSSEPLLFWAHDDTVEPGKTYKYRLRLGVFNPLAGTSKLRPESESYKDKVIIWSNFADAGTIEVPFRLYFFAKDIREAANTVIVEVFRYTLGYWHSKEYMVEAGEVIGKVDAPEEPKEDTEEPGYSVESVLIPEKVDFRTEAVMVDTVAVDDWAGGRNLRPRNYFNMYYSYDSSGVESVPIRQRFWSADEQRLYNDILVAVRLPKQPPRPRGSTFKGLRPGSPAEREEAPTSDIFKQRRQ